MLFEYFFPPEENTKAERAELDSEKYESATASASLCLYLYSPSTERSGRSSSPKRRRRYRTENGMK